MNLLHRSLTETKIKPEATATAGCGESMSSSGNCTDSSWPKPKRGNRGDKRGENHNRVFTSRLVFLLGLTGVAILLAFGAYKLTSESEKLLAEEQFAAISERALDTALEITLQKRYAAQSLATVVAYAFPEAQMWPYASLYGFEHIAQSVIKTANVTTMGLATKVEPDELENFTDYMYNVAFPANNYPNDTGISRAGKGVYSIDAQMQYYIEMDGSTYWNSTSDSIWPISMHSAAPLLLMMNLHSMESFGRVIDEVHDCANNRLETTKTLDLSRCAILSDFLVMYRADGSINGPSSMIMQPIYPAHYPNELVGVITSSIKWEEVLDRLFSSEVNGVDCVLQTESQTFTYHIHGGKSKFEGEGDLHNQEYSDLGLSIDLYAPGLFSDSAAEYKLLLYPNDLLFDVYSTANPIAALVGAISIVLFTSVLFFLYDFFVRKEFHHNQAVAAAKRQYVHYISHAVRTPLNAVVMGSQLVQDDMSAFWRSKVRRTKSNGVDSVSQNDSKTIMELQEKLTDWSGLTGEILQNTQSAVTVFNDLLHYDNVVTGEMEMETTIIPIWALIKRTVSEFHLSATVMGIDMTVDFRNLLTSKENSQEKLPSSDSSVAQERDDMENGPLDNNIKVSDLPREVREQRVIGDPNRVASILRHFLSNGIKFTPQGGNIKVVASIIPPDPTDPQKAVFTLGQGDAVSYANCGCVRIDIQDTGRGLTKDKVERLLEEEVQFDVNEMQAGEGSGLGLYISRRIAAQHGGFLSVKSDGPGRGSTFSVTLPLHHVPDDELPENVRHLRVFRGDMERLPVGTFRILVVDDIATNRKLFMRLLKNRGHVCDEAEDGKRAVELTKESIAAGDPYSVVLLDYEMPVMDGPTAAMEMRKLGCGCFICGVTCKILPEDVAFFKAQGANAVLPKPINMRDLEETWAEHGVSGAPKEVLA